jgi:hypothetical protein
LPLLGVRVTIESTLHLESIVGAPGRGESDLHMDDNFQALLDLAGVNAVMIFDEAGRLVSQRGKAIYDRPLCEAVSVILARGVDSIALQHPGWESAAAQFADGTVLLRNLGAVASASYVLAVVADGTLNPAFATVALRITSKQARRAIELGQGLTPSPGSSAVLASSLDPLPRASGSQNLGAPAHPASGSRPGLASSGVSWSQVGASGVSSQIATADPASSAYLSRCVKALAQHVGPMAKIFVEEAVRRVCQGGPFSLAQARPVAEELASQVEDADDRSAFLKAMGSTDAAKPGKPGKAEKPGKADAQPTLTTFATRSAVLFRPAVFHEQIVPAYKAFANDRERILLRELLERARPLVAKERTGLGPNLIIQSELNDALKKLGSELTPFGDLDRLARGTLVTGLVDALCVPWDLKEIPVQRTWGCPLSEYLEPRSPWLAGHLLRGVPAGTEVKLPSGAAIRLCAAQEVDRIRDELVLVPRPPGQDAVQREYDTLLAMLDVIGGAPDLVLALWSR